MDFTNCGLCPRKCHANRTVSRGICGAGDKCRIAKVMIHEWEEPMLVGTKPDGSDPERRYGAGAVFFSGCPLKCVYCQNYGISHGNYGTDIEDGELCEIFRRLITKNAATLDLVTPTQYLPHIRAAYEEYRTEYGDIGIPTVYNTGGYERVETLREYGDMFDIYLPDFKYHSPELAKSYSGAADYYDVTLAAIREMVRQRGKYVIDENGMLRSGVMIRHLVLPGARRDTEKILRTIAHEFGDTVLLSLMRQYTPPEDEPPDFPPNLRRRVCSYEYDKALELAVNLGLDGVMQEKSSAKREYTPDFDGDLMR